MSGRIQRWRFSDVVDARLFACLLGSVVLHVLILGPCFLIPEPVAPWYPVTPYDGLVRMEMVQSALGVTNDKGSDRPGDVPDGD